MEQKQNMIITGNMGDLKSNAQVFLKVNSAFKKMGFKNVEIGTRLKNNHFCEELELYIFPVTREHSQKEFYAPEKVVDKWNHIDGYRSTILRDIGGYDNDVESIIIDDCHIGNYYKNRNFAVLFFPIYTTNLGIGLKNIFLFHLLGELAKEIKRINPVLVDITKMIREELISKFAEGIKNTISGFHSNIRVCEENVEKWRREELESLSKIHQTKEQINALNGVQKMIEKNIEKKIAQIKKLPFVKRVGLSNLGIRVDFNHIDLDTGEEKVELGECYCYLNPNRLEIKNKNYVTYGGDIYHSPHIHNDTICFGDGKDKVYELLAELKLKELVYFIYLYLKTYNKHDTYLSIDMWKKCKNNGGEYEDE